LYLWIFLFIKINRLSLVLHICNISTYQREEKIVFPLRHYVYLTMFPAMLLCCIVPSCEGRKGGYRSHFTENKADLSQFTKNTTLAFHASRKIEENVLENHGLRRLWKSWFTRKKMAISHFTGNKKGRSRVTKIPFTTLLIELGEEGLNDIIVEYPKWSA